MRSTLFPVLVGASFMFVTGCGGQGANDDGESGNESPSAGSSSEAEGESGTGLDRGICERLIECAQEAGAPGVSTYVSLYGLEGSCWEIAGISESDCWIECKNLLDPLTRDYPEVESCKECFDDDDCLLPSSPYCVLDANACWEWSTCDPRNPDCPEGLGCYPDTFTYDYYCGGGVEAEPGAGSQFEPCERAYDCGSGMGCAHMDPAYCSGEWGQCCTQVCRLDDPSTCAGIGGGACVADEYESPPGWGFCDGSTP